MNIRVLYHSTTGNTKLVAEAMAEELGCKAGSITEVKSPVTADILFLGTAVYATYEHKINPVVTAFIEKLEPSKVKKAVLFCTGFVQTAVNDMKGLLEKRKIPVAESSFYCKGKLFVIFNFGHPNRTDLENARLFARKFLIKKQ
jgi:flavodoxin